jgi:NAD-dependent deacetylase
LSLSELESAATALSRAEFVVALTGAGISAESGIPTFRGPGGLWRSFRPEDLAKPQAFARDPELVWEWYAWRQGLVAKAEPNAGHRALVDLERLTTVTLVTQNVDGLHARAGSTDPIELHGSLWRVRCTKCESTRAIDAPIEGLPTCEECGALERPGVVWFGESLPEEPFELATQAVSRAQVVLVVGTSGVVQPAASLVEIGRARGATVIEVNPEASPGGRGRIALAGPAGEVLPELVRLATRPE